MIKLEDIKPEMQIIGLLPNKEVCEILLVTQTGTNSISVIFRALGAVKEQQIFRDMEEQLTEAQSERAWTFSSPSEEFSLALEARRMEWGCHFDPMMAVHSSNIEPLPHQITAVYESMLPKQPLRFILADDPGAGKTIMAGLLIKELQNRSDAQRILIVAPGSLTEQWQDELRDKFSLDFKLFAPNLQDNSSSGNFFSDEDRVIARLDQLARCDEYQELLKSTQWDLIIIDEAHKLSAHVASFKANITHRFRLGEQLRDITRHFLLLTATPHNGKEQDFRKWLTLIDPDRFYGKAKNDEKIDVSDIMRRLVKEKLTRFDGTRLFPKRCAKTINYDLSSAEMELYEDVTRYVVEEMNRAEKLQNDQHKGQVGFALTTLQRRLASSPAAIYNSLKRRRENLEEKLKQIKQSKNKSTQNDFLGVTNSPFDFNNREDSDDFQDEFTSEDYVEYEKNVDELIGRSTAATSITELSREIECLKILEFQAKRVSNSNHDCKWEQLSNALQDQHIVTDSNLEPQKLIIFTEHKDTLFYLQQKIQGLFGNPDAICVIHGGTPRDERRKIQTDFCNVPEIRVLLATDAAGEGVNLQRANLMVNYDLPWNPNRLEQRFGRIHRIGQTKTCYLWNMVAYQTREGTVFQRLFEKLEQVSKALGGQVFDVLGDAFDNVSLKDLLINAIKEGNSEESKRYMEEKVDGALDTRHIESLIAQNSLLEQEMTPEELYAIREEMEKAEARKLQPCYVKTFFCKAFTSELIKGSMVKIGNHQYKITHVPACIQNQKGSTTSREKVSSKYERVCFDKKEVNQSKNTAQLIHPAHPLMSSVIAYVTQHYDHYLKPGTVMIDPTDDGIIPSVVFLMDHCLYDATQGNKPISRRIQFVKMYPDGRACHAGWAPHLDLDNPNPCALQIAQQVIQQPWLSGNLEQKALKYASEHLASEHYQDVSSRRKKWTYHVESETRNRLLAAIDDINKKKAKKREEVTQQRLAKEQITKLDNISSDLSSRLEKRIHELKNMRTVISNPPNIIGGILVIPQGLINQKTGVGTFSIDSQARSRIEQLAMQAVMEKERSFGFEVKDVSADKCGWDVTSSSKPIISNPDDDTDVRDTMPISRHIEVKGRVVGADTITVTRNEVCYAINQADKFILAIVLIENDRVVEMRYLRQPFDSELHSYSVSENIDLKDFWNKGVQPEQTLTR